MRNITVTFADGTSHVYQGAPDDVTPDAVEAIATKEFGKPVQSLDGGKSAPPIVPRETTSEAPPNWIERQLAKLPTLSPKTESNLRGVAMGAADPSVGAVQLASHIPGVNTLLTPDGATNNVVDQGITNKEQQYESSRAASGRSGIDVSRIVGNVISPTNLVAAPGAGGANTAATVGERAILGAKGGAIGAALQPVTDTSNGYWGQKTGQVALGTAGGAALTPLAGKIGDAIMRRLSSATLNTGANASMQADQLIAKALKDVGANLNDLPPAQVQTLRQQVIDSLNAGNTPDAASIIRKQDFESVGIKPTLGQITRDPTQFARERNLRGVANVGEPLMQRFGEQGQQLTGKIGQFSQGAIEAVPAGEQLIGSLQKSDAGVKSGVDSLYEAARDNLGRAAPMNTSVFSKAANTALDSEMLGGVLPSQARNILNDVSSGKIPFNVNTAVQMDQTLSRLQRSGTPAEAYAIGKVRTALNDAPIADNVGEDAKAAFDAARTAAKARFGMLDAAPALKAAVNDVAQPDNFVKKYVINGNVGEVKNMMASLDPSAVAQARAQIGAHLEKAAFGENVTADTPFAQARFNKALAAIGTDKLGLFFSPAEVNQIKTLGRVGAYIHSVPNASPVNSSNTAAATMSMMGKIPGAPAVISMAGTLKGAIDNQSTVRNAINAKIPSTPNPMRADQLTRLNRFLAPNAVGAGGIVGSLLR